MNVHIKYNTFITQNTRNIVIFVSNISQLKNIDFLPNINFYLKDPIFINSLKKDKYFSMSNLYRNDNTISNILIFIIDKSIKQPIEIGSQISKHFLNLKNNDITFCFYDELNKNSKFILSEIILGFCIKSYDFNKYKNLKDDYASKIKLSLLNIKKFKELEYNMNLLYSINFTKDLISEPANILNPITYAKKCLELSKIGLKVKILDKKKIEKIGMKSLLAVSQGSVNDPRVVVLEWNIKNDIKPIVLVGKGVTFDTGGISIKPSSGMEEMITDMGGSAVVVGSMINASLNKSPKSLIGIIGLVENMPDGNAQRPGDIVRSLSGQTIEVLNTDAEGRMVLADIITYIQQIYKPKEIIDFATLTGAIMIALGTHKAGLFSNNDNLSNRLENSGNESGEALWRMPMGDEYDQEINSPRADMRNMGNTRFGGSTQAAQFIQRFVDKKIPWAHIDIAGVSWTMKSGQNSFSKLHTPGATAFGVRLINNYLKGN